MKHVQAGLIVGGITLAVLAVLSLVWALFSLVVGPMLAAGGVIVVIAVTVVAVIVDWKTEKR